jgi:thymidylate synthase (FAD)
LRVILLWHTDVGALQSALKERGICVDDASLMEHVNYMFEIEDVSRVTTHQLIRHRLASYDQESQRFSTASRESFIVPDSIRTRPEALKLYESVLRSSTEAFERMVALGVPKEDARYVMPHAIKTKLVMTLSAYSLAHIADLRTSPQAQWEIRELVAKMKDLARKATPSLWTNGLDDKESR